MKPQFLLRRLGGWLAVVALGAGVGPVALAATLPSVAVSGAADSSMSSYEGTVESLRQTTMAAQVPGAVVELPVRAGQRVSAGQLLLRIDARAANQAATASQAQIGAARAQLDVAAKDLERKRQLAAKNYISKAALEQAEAGYRAAAAQVNALTAAAAAATTQSGFYVVKAPYAGVISQLSIELGDMAMPGRPLLTLYDPASLRVTASVPSSVIGRVDPAKAQVELPDAGGSMIAPTRVEVLPAVDPRSLTQALRANLPVGLDRAVPGMFARVWLPVPAAAAAAQGGSAPAGGSAILGQNLRVPLKSIVRRGEMTGLYVLDAKNRPLLRQVRLGRTTGDQVEILSGLQAGERVVTQPQAAARVQ